MSKRLVINRVVKRTPCAGASAWYRPIVQGSVNARMGHLPPHVGGWMLLCLNLEDRQNWGRGPQRHGEKKKDAAENCLQNYLITVYVRVCVSIVCGREGVGVTVTYVFISHIFITQYFYHTAHMCISGCSCVQTLITAYSDMSWNSLNRC